MLGCMASTFGNLFRVTTFGESHGGAVGVVVDGCPPGWPSTPRTFRLTGPAPPGPEPAGHPAGRDRHGEILSGTFGGYTTGTPIAVLVRNSDARPEAYEHLRDVYRPSHADYTYDVKYGFRDWTGGGRASARETVGRVAAAAIARKLLQAGAGIEVLGWVQSVHDIEAGHCSGAVTRDDVEAGPTRCPDPAAADLMVEAIEAARRDGDSLGGVVECVCRGVPAGLGEPVFDKLEAALAGAMLSLPAAKGFEIGSGFAGTRLTGLAHNDPFRPDVDGGIRTASNRSGGVQGGISNGEDIVVRVAFKPTSTIASEQQTVTRGGGATTLAARGRHDPCVCFRGRCPWSRPWPCWCWPTTGCASKPSTCWRPCRNFPELERLRRDQRWKGGLTTSAGRSRPRTSMTTSSPTPTSGARNASAMPWPSTGEKLPLVTTPTSSSPRRTGQPSRGGRPFSARRPRNRRCGPASRSASSAARPLKSPLSQRTTQPKPAWSGVMPGPSS